MTAGSRAAAWSRAHPELVEGGAGLLAGIAVLAISLLQWGATNDGWTRGLTLGVAMGLVVTFSVRRGRRQREARERAAADLRLQLARDLHDAVASQVAIIGIQAAAARRVLPSQPERAGEALEVIEVAARAANADLREMLAALRADTAAPAGTSGLADVPALASHLRRAGLMVRVVGLEAIPALPPALDGAAYRIVQESLANALAHGGAVRASVTLMKADGVLRITVSNEAGTPTAAHPGMGFGLAGMRERAERFGGRLDASQQPDGVFVVEASMPVPRA
jgi:signal transduction histidine kinase